MCKFACPLIRKEQNPGVPFLGEASPNKSRYKKKKERKGIRKEGKEQIFSQLPLTFYLRIEDGPGFLVVEPRDGKI